jgi:exonuclease SbcD
MKIAHFSDTHIGFRAFSRLSEWGLNQRESDVFRTFERTLEDIESQDPDLIVHTGDFFDMVRPGNFAIVHAFHRLAAMQTRRKGRPLVIVAGNHESPRSAESGCILQLFGDSRGSGAIPGVRVAIAAIELLAFDGIEVLCIPTLGLRAENRPSFRRPTKDGVCILAAHGLDHSLSIAKSDFDIRREAAPEEWTYVALGDYHVFKELAPNAFYCGSTDYTTTNIWEEVSTPKGWMLFDTDSGMASFRKVEPVRQAIDLPVIDAAEMSGQEVGQALAANVTWPESELPIVRQRVINLSPAARAEIPGDTLREIRRRALNYMLSTASPTVNVESDKKGGSGGSLDDNWRGYAATRPIPPSLSRDRYLDSGSEMLREASSDTEEA